LFWDPGLGKTATVLHAFEILRDMDLIDTLLIVSTKNIVLTTWPEEIEEWGLPFSYSPIQGTEKKRIAALTSESDIYGINFENLQWLCSNHIRKLWGKDRCWLVIDESSKLRNVATKRFKSFRFKLDQFDRRTILTGTPIPNGYINIFGQMFCVDLGESLGKRIGPFRNQYFIPAGYEGYGWEIREGADKVIEKKISQRILRFDASKLNLPPLKVVDRWINLPQDAKDFYKDIEKEYLGEWQGKLFTVKSAGVATNKLRQIVGGAIYKNVSPLDGLGLLDEEEKANKVVPIHDAKIKHAVDLVAEFNGKPCLIAVQFTHSRKRLCEALVKAKDIPLPKDQHGKRYVPCIVGGTKDKDVIKYKNLWNAGKLAVLVGHPASMSYGMNMQKVNAHIIFFEMTWDLEHYIQFIKRVWRQGQKGTTMLYRILARDTIDEVMSDKISIKDTKQTNLLDSLYKYTQARLKEIGNYKVSTTSKRTKGLAKMGFGTKPKGSKKRSSKNAIKKKTSSKKKSSFASKAKSKRRGTR